MIRQCQTYIEALTNLEDDVMGNPEHDQLHQALIGAQITVFEESR